jgi:hypothetical protein
LAGAARIWSMTGVGWSRIWRGVKCSTMMPGGLGALAERRGRHPAPERLRARYDVVLQPQRGC